MTYRKGFENVDNGIYEIIAVTDRKLCKTDFLAQVKKIAGLPIRGIILREKDLTKEEYRKLAAAVLEYISEAHCMTTLIIHSHTDIWKELVSGFGGGVGLHLPYTLVRGQGRKGTEELIDFGMRNTGEKGFMFGTSIHAPGEAKDAQELGFNYFLAGHVFETDCKRGLPGRGTDFVRQVCAEVTVPVYAIGGISEENAKEVRKAGASGVCQMSGVMKKEDFNIEWLRAIGGGDYGRS